MPTAAAATMRAVQIDAFGGPEVMQVVDLPVPRPADDEVLIRVAYCGVCRHDLLTRAGAFPRAKVPVVLGHQVSGTVAAVGDSVTEFSPGDAVMTMIFVGCGDCDACESGQDALCLATVPKFLGEDYDGGYAEYVVVRERTAVKMPATIPLVEAAILTCTLGTAYHALIARGGLTQGQLVAITGASGGVGMHAVQVAKATGATVVAVVSSDHGASVALAAGADEVIVSAERRFAKELRARLGRQADIVLEVIGAPTLRESLHAVRPGGRVVVVGNVEGQEVPIPPAYLILKEISLIGTKSCTKEEMQQVLRLIASGAVRPEVSEVVPLVDARRLHERMEANEASGRIVLEVAGG